VTREARAGLQLRTRRLTARRAPRRSRSARGSSNARSTTAKSARACRCAGLGASITAVRRRRSGARRVRQRADCRGHIQRNTARAASTRNPRVRMSTAPTRALITRSASSARRAGGCRGRATFERALDLSRHCLEAGRFLHASAVDEHGRRPRDGYAFAHLHVRIDVGGVSLAVERFFELGTFKPASLAKPSRPSRVSCPGS